MRKYLYNCDYGLSDWKLDNWILNLNYVDQHRANTDLYHHWTPYLLVRLSHQKFLSLEYA